MFPSYFFVTQLVFDHRVTWPRVLYLAAGLGYFGWLYVCHRQGWDPRDHGLNRWAAAHPVWWWTTFGTVLVALIAAVIVF